MKKLKTQRKPRNAWELEEYKRLKRLKINFGYEDEQIPWVDSGHYRPDFTIRKPNEKILIEKKGYLRPEHKRILRAVKRTNPALDIRIVFYRHDKKNIRWSEKYGFPWAIGKIPKEWLI